MFFSRARPGLLLGTVCHRTIAQDDDIIQGLATVLAAMVINPSGFEYPTYRPWRSITPYYYTPKNQEAPAKKTSNVINKKHIKRTTKHTTKQKQSKTLINKTITRHRQKKHGKHPTQTKPTSYCHPTGWGPKLHVGLHPLANVYITMEHHGTSPFSSIFIHFQWVNPLNYYGFNG